MPFPRLQHPYRLQIPLQWALIIPFILPLLGALAWVGYLSFHNQLQGFLELECMAGMQYSILHTLLLCLFIFGVVGCLGWAIAHRIIAQISQLNRASQLLAAGDLNQQLPSNSGIVEIEELTQSFKQMATQLRQLRQEQIELEATHQSETQFQQLAASVPGISYTYTHRPDGTLELRVILPDGTVRWALLQEKVLSNVTGKTIQMAGNDIDITNQKLTETSLQQALQELTHHIENSPLATIRWDREFRIKLWSQQAEQIFGWQADEVIGKNMYDWQFIFEDDLERVQQAADQLLQGTGIICHNRNYQKDGSIVHCEWYNSILLDEQGNLVSILSLVQDVSDRQQTEVALAEESIRRQTLFNTSIDGIVVFDQAGHVLEANTRFSQMTGYSLDELLTLNRTDFFAHNFAESGQPDCNEKHFRNTFETRHRRKDGSIYDVEISSSTTHRDGQFVQLCICRDITDRKQAETALRNSEAALAQAQRIAHVGNWEFNILTQTITWSEELFRMFGLDPAQAEPSYADYLQYCIYPDDREKLQACVRGAIAEGTSYTIDYRATLPDGSIRYHEGRGEAEYNDRGEVIRLFGTAQDITERKQVEQELEQARDAAEMANRAKSAFLSTMSHELRTPLNVILGFTQLMTQDTTLSADHQDYMQLIHKNGSHLLRLINDILDLSRIEAGKMALDLKPLDLLNLLESLSRSFQQQAYKRRLQFHLHIAPEVPQHVLVDTQKLQQILLNLLGNAVKFTSSGHITLRVSVREETRNTAKPPTHSPTHPSVHPPIPSQNCIPLCFEIEDTGMGIAPEDINIIFEAFAQVNAGLQAQEGSGLGLAISRRLAHLMGGDLTVSSVLGQGSTFYIWIPVQPMVSEAQVMQYREAAIVGLASDSMSYRILVVDDQVDNRLLLKKLLRPLGFEVEAISNGQDALQYWKQWQPHLICMDLCMPAPDGYTITESIRQEEQLQHQTETPDGSHPAPCIIIALTAQASSEDRDRALAAGCNDYLSKPFELTALLNKISQHLGVRYRYANNLPMPEATSAPPHPPLTADSLAVMPQEWIIELYRVTLSCEQRGVQRLIEQIPPEHGLLASQLEQLAHDFEFDNILQLAQGYLSNTGFIP